MSNQFYDYLAEKLILFFKNNYFNPGSRFLINLDNKNSAFNLVQALKKYDFHPFEYVHDNNFEPFETFYLKFKEFSVVIAGPEVESGYLVTLRNVISELNEEKWQDKLLLVITDSVKDSIIEGSTNLQEKGFPLSMDFLTSNFHEEIKKSNLDNYICDILEVYLENLNDNAFYTTNIWDFESVISVLNKGTIDHSDFRGLNLFEDLGLSTLPNSSTRKKRIRKNYQLFLDILNIVNFKDFNKEIERKFDEMGVEELTKYENWYDADYNILHSSIENIKKKHSKLGYYGISSNVDYWDYSDIKNNNERHILLFNNKHLKNITVVAKFDRELDRKFLNKSSQDAVVSENTLKFKIRVDSDEPLFKRYTYQHEKIKKNKYIFNICVLNIPKEFISSINEKYKIKSNGEYILLDNDEPFFKFGDGIPSETIINDNFGEYDIINNTIQIDVKESLLSSENGEIDFNLIVNKSKIPFKIEDGGSKVNELVNSFIVWNNKRISQKSFIKEGDVLKQGKHHYNMRGNFKLYVDLEEMMINEEILFGNFNENNLEKINIELPTNIENIYNKIFKYFSQKNTTPSLMFIDTHLKKLYEELLDEFIAECELIKSGSDFLAFSSKKNLLKLGVIRFEDSIMFSSFSPLNIAYQLEFNKQCGNKILNKEILDVLVPNNLLPYIFDETDVLYSPTVQRDALEWTKYKNYSDVSIGTTDIYLSRLITDKLKDFINNFKYLFDPKFNAPIKINVVNIDDDKQIVKGIFEFIERYLPDNTPIPVEIHIYNHGQTYFDNLFECNDEKQLEDEFQIKLKSTDFDSLDILRTVQENIRYYCHNLDNFEFEYAHISFYKPSSNTNSYSAPMDEMETGMSLNGLISAVSSNNLKQDYDNHKNYRTGFGIKNADFSNKLSKLAKYLNELAYNSRKEGKESYLKNQSIVTMPDKDKDKILNDLFDKSNWVTFIDPNFGLDYFTDNGVFIIHYSDQYSASSKYDTITVTNKHSQYMYIIDEFLKAHVEEYQSEYDKNKDYDNKLVDVIKIFNSINGEWLLKIGSGNHKDKDKVSMVSAIKFALSIFDHEDIIWVPVSMAEVLRVSGNLGLKENEGLFSIKNLRKVKVGKYSDDLLLIGFNMDSFEIYLYPIEVKIGQNPSVSNAKKQVRGTYKNLVEFLSNDDENSFNNKFYRNFFIQMFLSNAQKFIDNNIFPEKVINRINDFKKELLNDQYVLSWKLKSLIGIGAFICFKDGVIEWSIKREEDILIIELPEADGYSGVVREINDIIDLIKKEKTNIPKKYLLYDKKLNSIENNSLGQNLDDNSIVSEEHSTNNSLNESNISNTTKNEPKYDKFGNFIGFN